MIGVIGGTGLNELVDGDVCEINDTPYGSISAPIIKTTIADKPVFFIARHGCPHEIPPHLVNYRANLWALKQLGVRDIFAVNAVGGISSNMESGKIVLADQIVDYTYGREHTFSDGVNNKLNHIDFSYPFNEHLRSLLISAAECLSIAVETKAVYGVTQGPRLESAAEIDRLERDGCEIVGMTAMPEAVLAREIALNYANVCLVVNPAAGRSGGLISMDDIQQIIDSGMQSVRALLMAAINRH